MNLPKARFVAALMESQGIALSYAFKRANRVILLRVPLNRAVRSPRASWLFARYLWPTVTGSCSTHGGVEEYGGIRMELASTDVGV